jgi:hypothetical protein
MHVIKMEKGSFLSLSLSRISYYRKFHVSLLVLFPQIIL